MGQNGEPKTIFSVSDSNFSKRLPGSGAFHNAPNDTAVVTAAKSEGVVGQFRMGWKNLQVI